MKEPIREQMPDIAKKRVEVFVDQQTGEFNYKEYEGEQLVEEVKNPKFVILPGKSYMESWEEDTQRHRFWGGYPEFEHADRPNRQGIMTEAKALLKVWFRRGVTYDRSMPGLLEAAFGILGYTNAPDELYDCLEIAFGRIKANILEWKKIPEYLRPQLLMTSPAIPLASLGLKGEHKATFFTFKVNGPSHGPVYWTEGVPPKERAELVGDNWYDLQSHRLYGFISETYITESDQWKQPQSVKAIEKQLEIEGRLKAAGLNQIDRIELYACRQNFEYAEVAGMERSLGTNKTAEAVRKNYNRSEESLILKELETSSLPVDELAARTGKSSKNVRNILTHLESRGTVFQDDNLFWHQLKNSKKSCPVTIP